MNTTLVALLAAATLCLCSCRSTNDMSTPATIDTLTLLVIDRSGHVGDDENLSLASSANAWNPEGTPAIETIPAQGDTPRTFRFELPYRVVADPGFRFKFTRGTWETVETQADGHYLPNRTLVDELEGKPATITLEVLGFADDMPDLPSTIVGEVVTFELESEHMGNSRTLRVWLPPDYETSSDSYPVLYMHDGQNCFDVNSSAFGMEWQIDETLTALIDEGEIDPVIVVAIDNAGAARSWEYNPPEIPFQGRNGRADQYVKFLTEEVMPAIEARFRVKTGPEHTAIGGSSFGGNVTIYALMHTHNVFGAALIESPAITYAGPAFEQLIKAHEGPWCERVCIGMGTKETGDPARDPIYAAAATMLADHMLETGVNKDHLTLTLEQDAEHNELAWAKRFPDAARHLFGR